MPEQPLVDLVGAVDIHVHSGPSYTEHRPYSDDVTARQAFEAGLGGLLLKDHNESTVTRAYLVQKALPGIRVFGGLVLNHSVGGINPEAADFALTVGGKQIWMPTIDAARHTETFGQGGFRLKASGIGRTEPAKKSREFLKKGPIRILENGSLIDEAKDVVKICKAWDAMLGVGHLCDEEVVELVRFAKDERFDKVIITHANWTVIRGHKPQELRELTEMGAWVEFCAIAILPPYNCLTVEEEVRWLGMLGTQRCILASDAGSQIYPSEPSVLRSYLQLLNNFGVPVDGLRLMSIDSPKLLLHMS